MNKDEYPLLADNFMKYKKLMPPTRMPFCKLKI